MWPHSLEICVLSRRHLFNDISFFDLRSINNMVDLHIESEQSYFSLILDETIDILELLVLIVLTADGAYLELISNISLTDNIFSFLKILVMNVFLILSTLMVSSKDVFLENCTVCLLYSELDLGRLSSLQMVAPVADNSVLFWLVNKNNFSMNHWFIRVSLVLEAPQ